MLYVCGCFGIAVMRMGEGSMEERRMTGPCSKLNTFASAGRFFAPLSTRRDMCRSTKIAGEDDAFWMSGGPLSVSTVAQLIMKQGWSFVTCLPLCISLEFEGQKRLKEFGCRG